MHVLVFVFMLAVVALMQAYERNRRTPVRTGRTENALTRVAHTPAYALPPRVQAEFDKLIAQAMNEPAHAQEIPAPTPEEGDLEVNAERFEMRRRVRSALNHHLATYLRDLGVSPTGDAWASARRSHVAVLVGDEFVGDWPGLDDACEALLGLDTRDDVLTSGHVLLVRNVDDLAMLRMCGPDGFTDASIEATPEQDDLLHPHEWFAEMMDALAKRAQERKNTLIIQPVISSTERMRSLRDARKAAGLTARGTEPLPMCGRATKTGHACKRKAQPGRTSCDWHTYGVSAWVTA